ncbi:uncharacterized protein LOC136083160 isoform X2 [Hydra vulgaris]|uniref:Uncharacterized protein LOC136083160 isoform X2 n=1 Tax=Hydra vulgaris TaxID=6087 RepID=A0ABM4CAE3_HYDVU
MCNIKYELHLVVKFDVIKFPVTDIVQLFSKTWMWSPEWTPALYLYFFPGLWCPEAPNVFKTYKHDTCNIYFTALLQPNSASENTFNQSSIVQEPLPTTFDTTNTMLLENVPTESFSVETDQSLFSSNEPMMTELFTASTQADLISTNLVLPESPESVSTCNVSNCRLPSCRCAGTDIPGGLSKVNTPQMILLTMDDGVTPEKYQLYTELLNGSTNFNGCPIKATFFVSGDNSDYAYVKKLQQSGHEIADHSATHKLPEEWWSKTAVLEDLQMEILTQKNTIQQEVGTTTLGWRTPFLASQENTFKVLAENQFLYDSSLGTIPGTRWWPYTMDYLPSLPCYMANCPTLTYPGVWEIPLVTLQCDESATTFATMLDECTNLETEESTYNMLMTNFKLHYEDNKQPFPMFGHSTWFDNAPYRKDEKAEMAKKMVLLLLVAHQMSANVIKRDTLQTLLQPNSASENTFNQSSIVQEPLPTTFDTTNTMLLENVPTESFSVETDQSLFSSNEPMMTELFTASTQADLISTNLVLPESPESVSTCNVSNCRLPSCRCAGTDIPGGLSKVNTPQMILLTMDDGVTPEKYQLYTELLNGSTNFNGCPIKATFFVSGDNSDYAYVKKLQQSGHEIADHSATHKLPEEWWSKTAVLEDLQMEILTQKNTIQQEVGTTTLGWRTPFLASQENTFKVLAENQFLYDSSLGTIPGTRWWPYTMDYLPSLPCYMANCPTLTYPGVWEIPLVTLQCDESATTFATMLDECTNLETEESTYNMLMTNFKLHYEDNKQPFPMFGHSTWFDNAPYRKDAVIRFLNDVRKFSDVYFVTAQQAIEWIKSPVGLDKKPFSCNL